MKTEFVFLFLGMALVTYIPRVLPFYLGKAPALSGRLTTPLKLLPCAAIGALIFPNGPLLYTGSPLVAPVALVAGGLVTWFSENIPFGIFTAILLSYLLL